MYMMIDDINLPVKIVISFKIVFYGSSILEVIFGLHESREHRMIFSLNENKWNINSRFGFVIF